MIGRAESGKRRIGRPSGEAAGVGRDKLLALTCELLKTTHHREITRAMVARLANVDPGLIRYYFNTHSDLLYAAAEKLTQEFAHFFEQAIAAGDRSPKAQLVARIHALVELTATYPYYSRFVGDEVMFSDSEVARGIFGTLMDRGISRLEIVTSEGMEQGYLRPIDPKLLFSTIVGMCEFFLHTKRRSETSSYPEEGGIEAVKARYKRFVCDLLFAGILAGNEGTGLFPPDL